MSPLDIIILIAALVNVVLFAIVFLHSKHKHVETFFAVFALSVGLWSLATFLSTSAIIPFPLFKIGMMLHFLAGNLVFFFLFWFSIYFPFANKNNTLPAVVSVINAAILLMIFFTPFLFSEFRDAARLEDKVLFNAWGYVSISAITLFMFVFSQVNLWNKQAGVNAILDKTRIRYVVFGTSLTGAIGLMTNLIMPAFDNFSLFFIGPIVTTPFFVGVMMYTIVQYQLFNLRIIAAEVFATLLVVVSTLNLFRAQSGAEFILQAGGLMVAAVFAFFLVRGVYQEVRSREEIERLAADLARANERLKELDQRKSEFVSLASHQLRSPLTAIKGYASMLLEGSFGALAEKAREAVDRIFQSSERLVMLVEDFLTISRIEQGRLAYNFARADIRELANIIVTDMRPSVEKKGLTLSFDYEKGAQLFASVDKGKMAQVVGNLIDNAVKYTQKGSVSVYLEKDEQKNAIRFSVKDTGIGMSPETKAKVFSKFVRADNAHEVNVSGSGLGLFIAKQLVEAHHGRIWAESNGEGKGSTFYFEIPADAEYTQK